MTTAHSPIAPPIAPAYSHMDPAYLHMPPPIGPAHSYTAQQLGPAAPSSYRQLLLEEHYSEEVIELVSRYENFEFKL